MLGRGAVDDIVRYFAERKKIFNIHFRNIVGGLHDFAEVWPDEGDVDMFKLCETLFLAGYDHMLMPDHAPVHPEDVAPPGAGGRVKQAWAFQFGYIAAVIQAVKMKVRWSSHPGIYALSLLAAFALTSPSRATKRCLGMPCCSTATFGRKCGRLFRVIRRPPSPHPRCEGPSKVWASCVSVWGVEIPAAVE